MFCSTFGITICQQRERFKERGKMLFLPSPKDVYFDVVLRHQSDDVKCEISKRQSRGRFVSRGFIDEMFPMNEFIFIPSIRS